jgi:hypothetical protein
MKLSFAVACLLGFTKAAEPVWSLESVQNHRTDSNIQKAYGDHSTDKANSRPPYQSAVQLEGKDEPVWALSSVLGHQTESGEQIGYGGYSTVMANARPPYKSYVNLESDSESSDSESDDEQANAQINADKVIDKNPIYNAWESVKDGAPDGKYERVITPHFASDSDDIFMRSMITKYAHEKRTPIEELDDGTKIGGEPTGSFWLAKKSMMRAAKEVLGTHKGLSGGALDDYLDTYFDRAWSNFDVNGDGSLEVIKAPQFMRFLASDQGMSLGESA